jgi:hypothetical protein
MGWNQPVYIMWARVTEPQCEKILKAYYKSDSKKGMEK